MPERYGDGFCERCDKPINLAFGTLCQRCSGKKKPDQLTREQGEALRREFGLSDGTSVLLPLTNCRFIVRLPSLSKYQVETVLRAASAAGVDLTQEGRD